MMKCMHTALLHGQYPKVPALPSASDRPAPPVFVAAIASAALRAWLRVL
jgi:hypothetical protein